MAADHVDTEVQVRVQAEVWDLMAGSQDPTPFFSPFWYILTLLFISWCGSTACCSVVTAGARAAPRVCKPSLQAATPEKVIAPTVGKRGMTCLHLICCTHIRGWNSCLFIPGNFICLKYFGKKPKPLSEKS